MSDHGTVSSYVRGCRCDECRAANTEKARRDRKRRRDAGTKPARHGAAGYGNHGCRCEVCCAAHREATLRNQRAYLDRAQARRTRGDLPESFEHGENAYRVHGCRCAVCTSAYHDRLKVSAAGNSRSRDAATRFGQQWTGPELEIISRTDITRKEMARLTGRTEFAVRTMRHKLQRGEPIPVRLAGKPLPK